MIMAIVTIIMVTLVFGVAYKSLSDKNNQHEQNLQNQHQLKTK